MKKMHRQKMTSTIAVTLISTGIVGLFADISTTAHGRSP
jgi:hypothetical protein